MSELLPCPFCGGIAEICYQRDDIGDWKIECQGCGAVSCPEGMRYDKQEAINDWNNRFSEVVMAEESNKDLMLDVSVLEKARALHRVWRALNDGDCPHCHKFHAATEIIRSNVGIQCPSCEFFVTCEEIEDIEKMFAPAMDAAVDVFFRWREWRDGAENG